MIKQTTALIATAATLVLAGCRQDMHDQPKVFPQRGTPFFQDGRSARPQVENTVARNQLHEDAYFSTGMTNGKEGEGLPFPATLAVLERGQERYNIYCAPCHSRVGNGDGMVVQRGYRVAGDFQSARLTEAPLGHFFNVITNGFGAMPDYAAQLTPADRWAVAAYIRALQLSQNAKPTDVPAGAKVEDLRKITVDAGLPEDFVSGWKLPATAAPMVTTAPGAAQKVQPAATPASGAPAAPPAQNNQAPKAADRSAVAIPAGHDVYAHNCQGCHTAARTGRPPAIPSLVGIVGRIGAVKVQQTVANGVQSGKVPMPAFGDRLSPAEMQHLIAYLTNPESAAPAQSGN